MASRLPFSKSHIERLGGRLIESERPAAEDIAELQALLAAYGVVLDEAVARVRAATDLTPTARVKSTGTILEKLRRDGGSWLKSMQDLAGMRVVRAGTRIEQDGVVDQLLVLFGDDAKSPKVIDRRAEPMHGYSAVHVIVFLDDAPIEIQVRTVWQHEWAELFEKLADRVGRGIRYGEPPAPPSDPEGGALLTVAKATARHIAGVEEIEAGYGDVPGLEAEKARLRDQLDRLGRILT